MCLPALANRFASRGGASSPRVSYGHRRLPRPGEPAHGGMVKLQALQAAFPGADRFDLAYLVSSALPAGAVPFAAVEADSWGQLLVRTPGFERVLKLAPDRSVAELGAALKNAHSHRAIASTQMLALMREVWRLG